MRIIIISFIFLFLIGLSFHFDQSYFDFGEILLPGQFSIRSHLLFISGIVFLMYLVINKSFRENELSFFILLLIFLPSVYVYRFGIFDELLVILFTLAVFIRDGFSKIYISKFHLLLVLFLMSSAFVGLFYSLKSFRYIFQAFSILMMIFYLSNKQLTFNSKIFINALSYISSIYYSFLIFGFIITAYNASFLNLYLYGIGYSPTTIVNLPSIIVVPILSYCFIKRQISYSQYIVPILLGLIITILSDSRTGFFPYLLCFPIVLFYVGIRKSILLFLYIFIAAYFIGIYQFNNPFWIIDTISSLFDIFKIGGTTQITYYDHTYDSASGDTGRFIYIFSPFLFYINNPIYFLTGVGTYGFFEFNYQYIVVLSQYFQTSLDIVTSGLVISGKASIPRPPTFPSFLIEYGLIFTGFIYYTLIRKVLKIKFTYFYIILYFLIISLSFFLEIHESMLFYFLIFNKKNNLHEIIL